MLCKSEPTMRFAICSAVVLSLALVALPIAANARDGVALLEDQTPEPPQVKSPGLALGLSIGAPLVGYGMIAAAMLSSGHIQDWQKVALVGGISLGLLGPSAGHFYTGHYLRAALFDAGRVALFGLAFLAFAEGMKHEDSSESTYDRGAVSAASAEVILCGVGLLALTVWESIDSYYSAVQVNRTSQRTVALSPLVVPGRDGVSLAGLSLVGRY
jgi:hypothetical protein